MLKTVNMNMTRIQLLYILLISILIAFSGCQSQTDDDSSTTDPQSIVYLSVTRAQVDGLETFNADDEDYEDRVHDMAMLVFDSSTGTKVGEYFDEHIALSEKDKSFVIQLTPGKRNFYFVANMPVNELKKITTQSDMDVYMNTFSDLDPDLYLSASEDKGFPMSRVYRNQIITEGGSLYSPQPFRPDNEDRVKLIRVVAKLDVRIDTSGNNLDVKNVYYKNASRQFSLTSPLEGRVQVYYEDKPLKKVNNTYLYYIPEALMISPSWPTAVNHRPINYFVIETLDGTQYEIPIVTYDGTIPEKDYLSFAMGNTTEKPDYNVYRNRHYLYTIKKLETLEIVYTIDPWHVVENSTYMGYGYNVEVSEDGNVTISNTIEACDPHKVTLETVGDFKFSDGTTTKTFTDADPQSSVQYVLSLVPTSGTYMKVYYNGNLVKTFSK